MSLRAFLAVTVVAAVALAAKNPPDDAPPANIGPERWAFTSASCDEHDQAFNVEPDTPEAWSGAQDWCIRSGVVIDNHPWPSGFKPTTLPEGADRG